MVYNMNEKQGESFTKVVLRKAGRAKERILQNFGKADRTTDELFELYENNFNKQQNSAIRLQKEIKNYVTCIRSMQAASKNLMDCLCDIYEPEFTGHDQIPFKAQILEALWEELCTKLNDQVTIPLSTYLSQFSEIKAKIDKRGRKLVDYDGSRHALESVQNNHKKKDEIKLAKLRDEQEGARRLYDVLNKELHEELPALYDSRIPFLISILQTLFATQSAFYGQNSRVQTQLNNYVDELALEAKKGTYHINARLLASNFNPHLDPLSGQIMDSNAALHLQSSGNLTRSQQQLHQQQQNAANYSINNNGQVLMENAAAAMKFMASQANQQQQLNPNMQQSSTTGPHKIVVSDANSPISSTTANLHNQGVLGHENHPDAIKVKSDSKKNLKNETNSATNSLTATTTATTSITTSTIQTQQQQQPQQPQPQPQPQQPQQPPNNTSHNEATANHKHTNGHVSDGSKETNGLSKSPSPIVHHISIEKDQTPPTETNSLVTNVTNNKPEQSPQHPTKNIYEIPHGATTKDLPPDVFYKVKATYKYDAEDEDELSFEAGETIYVIEYEYPEEQEDGWLMGCKSSDGQKGLFPQNFTMPV